MCGASMMNRRTDLRSKGFCRPNAKFLPLHHWQKGLSLCVMRCLEDGLLAMFDRADEFPTHELRYE